MESAKARMAFVRPLVEAIIPDIQGIGDNAAKAQQSWSNGQYLSATEAAGVVLVGMAENLPALKAAKAAGKVDNLLPTHIPDATTRAVQSAGSAKAAADIAQQAGRASGAAAELRVNGQVFTDVSTGGAARDLHPSVKSGLDQVPLSQRAPWHGHCAEAGCVSQALEAGVNPAGGTSKAVNIGTSGKGHGTPKPACTSCQHLLDQFGVKHD